MSVKLLTENHLEFLSSKGGCTGSSESTLVKIPHCWKSHVTAQMWSLIYWYLVMNKLMNFTCTIILTKIHPNYRWITGETDKEFQFSSWNWQGDGILAKIQVGLPKDSMWIFLIPAGNFQAHGISFSGFFHLECFLIVFFKIHLETLKDKKF